MAHFLGKVPNSPNPYIACVTYSPSALWIHGNLMVDYRMGRPDV